LRRFRSPMLISRYQIKKVTFTKVSPIKEIPTNFRNSLLMDDATPYFKIHCSLWVINLGGHKKWISCAGRAMRMQASEQINPSSISRERGRCLILKTHNFHTIS
jgi:hypothetical protein